MNQTYIDSLNQILYIYTRQRKTDERKSIYMYAQNFPALVLLTVKFICFGGQTDPVLVDKTDRQTDRHIDRTKKYVTDLQ